MSWLKKAFLFGTAGILALMLTSPLFPVRAGLLDLLGGSPPTAPDQPAWQLHVEPEDRLFPSYIIAASTRAQAEINASDTPEVASGDLVLGESEGPISVTLTVPAASLPVRLVVTGKAVMDESVLEASLPAPHQKIRLRPKILWRYPALLEARQAMPTDITAELWIGNQCVGRQTRTVKLHTINDCPFTFAENDEFKDTWWMYAAYVNENHPLVDSLLKEAFAQKIVTQFDEYQSGDPREVYRQVYAIWHLLHTKGIHYSSLAGSSDNAEKVGSQFVRFLDETMASSQANCVDGSVLFASILRKIGIDAFLVMTPEHMWVGFYLDDDRASKRFIETTQLGLESGEEEEEAVDAELYHFFGDEYADRPSWKNFVAAVRAGRDLYAEHRSEIETGEANHGIVDIEEARAMGVMPIAFTRGTPASTTGSR